MKTPPFLRPKLQRLARVLSPPASSLMQVRECRAAPYSLIPQFLCTDGCPIIFDNTPVMVSARTWTSCSYVISEADEACVYVVLSEARMATDGVSATGTSRACSAVVRMRGSIMRLRTHAVTDVFPFFGKLTPYIAFSSNTWASKSRLVFNP